MAWETFFLIGIIVAIGVGGIITFGVWRWRRKTRSCHAAMLQRRQPTQPSFYAEQELAGLPAPVQRYFQTVLPAGQPIITVARFSQTGQFRGTLETNRWSQFSAKQIAITHPPTFDWDARIQMAPGMTALVHDSYLAGTGILHAELWGLVTVADVRDNPLATQAELLRYLSEAVWYPTALLPSQGIRWEAMDETRAKAYLTDSGVTVSLIFTFDPEGLITEVLAEERYRGEVDDQPDLAPWQGHFWHYESRGGIKIPLEGEVSWKTSAGTMPYWRGRITEIHYEDD